MKKMAVCIFMLIALVSSLAQTAPTLTNSIATNGDLVVTWPVQVIFGGTTNLAASYQLEFATELNDWTPTGDLISGARFSSRVANVRINNVPTQSATFVRVRAIFDFTGGSFIHKTIRNAPLANAVFSGADMFGAQLDGSSLDNADLSAADLRFASMTQISATNADFTLARLSPAIFRWGCG